MSATVKDIHSQEISFSEGDEYFILEPQTTPVCEWIDPLHERVGDKMVFAYACVDNDPWSPSDDGDGNGKVILLSHRHSNSADVKEAMSALALDEGGRPNLDELPDRLMEEWVLDPGRREEAMRWTHRMKRPWNFSTAQWEIGIDLTDKYDEDDIEYTARVNLDEVDFRTEDPFERAWLEYILPIWRQMALDGKVGVKYSQVVDVYEHGQIHVSLGGTTSYPDEQWDVSRGGGVWIPDPYAIENLDDATFEKSPEEARAAIRKYASACIEMWNDYWNGNVYGVIRETHSFNEEGQYGDSTLIEEDSCWGHYGSDYAKETVKEYLVTEVKWLKEQEATNG